jgi:DNA-binding beta-propeller fold protein YncE
MDFSSLLTVRAMGRAGLLISTFAIILLISPSAQAQTCNAPAPDVIDTVSLPGAPFSAIPTTDGCTIFVSVSVRDPQAPGHIAVLNRAAGKVTLAHDVAVPSQGIAAGMALSHDGKLLAVANGSGVLLLDTGRLMAGDGKPIAEAKDAAGTGSEGQAGSVYAAVSPDDKLLVVSDEGTASLTVYDLAKLQGGDTNAIGRIPVGIAPVGLVFSQDGQRLYSTSEIDQPGTSPRTCPGEGGSGGTTPQGLLTVVDVARAASDPAGSILAKVPGGCDPVRITLSKDGARAFVTARGADSLLVFDTAKLVADSGQALIETVIAGKSPVGVAMAGQNVVTADSNRFSQAGRTGEWLSVIDPVTSEVIGNVPTGLFPRELYVTADGKTLLVTNFSSNSLALVDLAGLTPAYFAQQKPVKDADDAQQAKLQAEMDERTKNHQSDPGTEAALRHIIPTIANGMPDFDAMGPGLANAVRQQTAAVTAQFQKFGAFQSITFKAAGPNGTDIFEVTFEHAKTNWSIFLSPDGKIAGLYFRLVN